MRYLDKICQFIVRNATLRFTVAALVVGYWSFAGVMPAAAQSREPGKGIDDRAGLPPSGTAGGPDAFGYRWIDSDNFNGPTFNWQDISGVGTAIFLGDDDSAPVALPFSFPFYGAYYTSVRISSNGYLTFDADGAEYLNDDIPDPSPPNNYIAPYWDDLDPSAGLPIYHYYDAVADEFIVQYTNMPAFDGNGPYTFQVKLRRGGSIIFQYLSMTKQARKATIGIENATGTDGLPIVFNAKYAHDNLAVHLDWKRRVPEAYQTIQAAINETASGDTVLVGPGTYTGPLNKNLTFLGRDIVLMSEAGAGATIIDCEDFGRGINLTSFETQAAVVDGFTIRNGAATSGGAVFLTFASPTIRNCVFENSTAIIAGGGIYMLTSNPHLSDCSVTSNTATLGGGVYAGASSPTIENSTIDGNTATSSGGGLLYALVSAGTVSGCTITSNEANLSIGEGGGLAIGTGSAPTISATSITMNTASHGGGVGVSPSGTPLFDGSTISHNSAVVAGGGFNVAGNATIKDCEITGNTSTDEGGAGLHITDSPTVAGCDITENRTTSDGGGIKIVSGNPWIAGCKIAANTATNGGGVRCEGGSGTLSECTVTGNVATSSGGGVSLTQSATPTILGSTVASNYAGVEGGGVAADQNDPVSLDRTIVWGNCAVTSGEEVQADSPATLSFSCCTIDASGVEGAGITNFDVNTLFVDPLFCFEVLCSATPTTAGDYTLDDNSQCLDTASPCLQQIGAQGEGCTGRIFDVVERGYFTIQAAIDGTVDAVGDTVVVTDSTWTGTGNTALDFRGKRIVLRSKTGPDNTVIDCQGLVRGVIFEGDEDATSVLEGVTIKNGAQTLPGSAILIRGGSSPTVRGCKIMSTTADNGVICVDGGTPTLESLRIEQNTSTSQEGVLAVVNGLANIVNCTVENNNAAHAVSVTAAAAFANTSVIGNSGVGIRFASSLPSTVSGSDICENGGRGAVLEATAVNFVGTKFLSNDGGGVAVTGLGGVAARSGGVERASASSTSATFTDCDFSGNTAARGAGFLFDCDNEPLLPYTPTFDNCQFSGNHASLDGGGIAICGNATNADIIPYFINCTIAANSAEQGGGIFMGVSNLGLGVAEAIFERTILWGNCSFVDTFGNGYVMTDNTLEFNCSHIDYPAMAGAGNIDTLLVTSGLPAFCDYPRSYYTTECDTVRTIQGDFSLAAVSPDTPDNSPCSQLIGSAPVISCVPTAIEDETPELPVKTVLEAPAPNPFNPATTIAFSLASQTHVTVRVYDVKGRLVRTLVDKTMTQANHRITWDGLDDQGIRTASGVYFLHFTAGDVVENRKMVLLK